MKHAAASQHAQDDLDLMIEVECELLAEETVLDEVIRDLTLILAAASIDVVAPCLTNQTVHEGVLLCRAAGGELDELAALVEELGLQEGRLNIEEAVRLRHGHHELGGLDHCATVVREGERRSSQRCACGRTPSPPCRSRTREQPQR